MQTLIFKFPFQKEYYILNPNSNQKNTVKFHSFDTLHENIFEGSIQTICEEKIIELGIKSNDFKQEFHGKTEIKEQYIRKLERVIKLIKKYKLPKIVISRQKWVSFKSHEIADLGKTFLNLCHKYPNTFIYLFINNKDSWIGATPEVLGSYNKKSNIFETMSLAGTLPIIEEWSEKEIEEQKPVNTYIHSILKKFSNQIETSSIYDHILGNIKHLRKDFKAFIQEDDISKIIEELHPTPAVCGTPKELCFNIIKSIENHNRNLYTGYIHIEHGEKINYYVNLRCAQLFRNGILLYAGGGITPTSKPEKEWRETELKNDAILQCLSFFST